MKVFILFLFGIIPLITATGNLQVNVTTTTTDDYNSTKPECIKDLNCPTIFCIRAPCPTNVCRENKCVVMPAPTPNPVKPPVRSPIPECVKDLDCPIILCKRAPCPTNVCRQNKCVVVPAPTPSPVKPPVKSPTPECVKDLDCPTIFCIRAPCPTNVCRENKCVVVPSPTSSPVKPPVRSPIIAGGPKCGKNTCSTDQVCCNASCGICTPKGGACIQLACVDDTPTSRPTGKPRLPVATPIVHPPVRAPVPNPVTKSPVSVGLKCGKNMCGADEYCCNPSCGICARRGVLCIQKVCTGTPTSRPTNKPRVPITTPIAHPPVRTPVKAPVASGIKCGKNMCNSTEVCCNESCGICTKPGGACPMIGCVDPPVSKPLASPVVKPNPSPLKPYTSSPVRPNGYCKADSDCPIPSCAKPVDGIVSYCPTFKCINNKCSIVARPTSKPITKLVYPPPPVTCGKNTCSGGDVCCDPLCGTCTKPGMACVLGCSVSKSTSNNPLYHD